MENASWLGPAVFGALIAALGYVGKMVIDGVLAWQRARAARLTRLIDLSVYLKACKTAFDVQIDLAQRLLNSILKESQDSLVPSAGYDRVFTEHFGSLTPEQKELHTIIRGYTEYALRPTNSKILEWLRNDRHFRNGRTSLRCAKPLSRALAHLDGHLLLWEAKYQAWFRDEPRHALVFLADEERHGLGFPREIDDLVAAALAELGEAGGATLRRSGQSE